MNKPSISKVTIPALLAVILLPTADFITSFPLAAVLWACGAVLGFVALVLTGEYILGVVADYQEARREMQTITPRRREIEAVSRLRPDQVALVSKPDSKLVMSAHRSGGDAYETALWFSTPGGLVPYEFAQEFLQSGGVTNLRPISSYSEGSFGYEYARLLTDWARAEGLAVGGEGSRAGRAAEWVSHNARQMAFELFDVSMDMDQEIERLR